MVGAKVTGDPALVWFAGDVGDSSVGDLFRNRGNISGYMAFEDCVTAGGRGKDSCTICDLFPLVTASDIDIHFPVVGAEHLQPVGRG